MLDTAQFKVFTSIILLLLVLVLTYYATKYVARMMGGTPTAGAVGSKKSSAITVPGRVIIGKGQGLITVQYDGQEYLLGVTDHQMTVIAARALTPEELAQPPAQSVAGSFSDKLVKACSEYAQKKKNEGKE